MQYTSAGILIISCIFPWIVAGLSTHTAFCSLPWSGPGFLASPIRSPRWRLHARNWHGFHAWGLPSFSFAFSRGWSRLSPVMLCACGPDRLQWSCTNFFTGIILASRLARHCGFAHGLSCLSLPVLSYLSCLWALSSLMRSPRLCVVSHGAWLRLLLLFGLFVVVRALGLRP